MTTYNVFPDQLSAETAVADADQFMMYDASSGTMKDVTFAIMRASSANTFVDVSDANYTVLAANSGIPHIIANVSADRTISLPTAASGLYYKFIADINAADGHDWIFDTGSDTNYFTGGVTFLDADAGTGADEIVPTFPDGDSNSKLQINLPNGGTWLEFYCDGTLWTVVGNVVSATAPTFADQ